MIALALDLVRSPFGVSINATKVLPPTKSLPSINVYMVIS